jgi:hypothetical protein
VAEINRGMTEEEYAQVLYDSVPHSDTERKTQARWALENARESAAHKRREAIESMDFDELMESSRQDLREIADRSARSRVPTRIGEIIAFIFLLVIGIPIGAFVIFCLYFWLGLWAILIVAALGLLIAAHYFGWFY